MFKDSPEDREEFKKNPSKLQAHGKSIERRLNGLFPNFYSGTDHQRNAIKFFYDQMKIKIKDPRLLQGEFRVTCIYLPTNPLPGFTPEFVPGCRRITPGDPFIHAVQEPNVEVVFKGVAKLTEDGVVDTDGVERKVDAVVCATGRSLPRRSVHRHSDQNQVSVSTLSHDLRSSGQTVF